MKLISIFSRQFQKAATERYFKNMNHYYFTHSRFSLLDRSQTNPHNFELCPLALRTTCWESGAAGWRSPSPSPTSSDSVSGFWRKRAWPTGKSHSSPTTSTVPCQISLPCPVPHPLCDPDKDGRWVRGNVRKLNQLPYHLLRAQRHQELYDHCLFNLSFLQVPSRQSLSSEPHREPSCWAEQAEELPSPSRPGRLRRRSTDRHSC